jgi:glycosyltransferase involved in cell wall biosynthesis
MHDQIIAQPFMRAKSVTAIQNAIDCTKYYAPDQRTAHRRELGFASDAIVLGYTGRIESGKRLSVLLRAFVPIEQRWPNACLLVVGEGTQRRILSDFAARLNIAYAVTWAGFRSDIAHLLAAMDIYVQPSINEGFSLSILEAMAAQKPIVAVDIPGVREVIQDGRTGLLVPRSSPSSLQAALTDLLCQPDKQALLGQNARGYVCAKFDLQSMTSAYEHIYQALAIK